MITIVDAQYNCNNNDNHDDDDDDSEEIKKNKRKKINESEDQNKEKKQKKYKPSKDERSYLYNKCAILLDIEDGDQGFIKFMMDVIKERILIDYKHQARFWLIFEEFKSDIRLFKTNEEKKKKKN
jgi:hypothetical protein